MALPIAPGNRVDHKLHGKGMVLDLLPRNRARVRFDSSPGLPRTVWATSLEKHTAPSPVAEETAPPAPAAKKRSKGRKKCHPSLPVPTKKAYIYQTVMEALRLGVVPAEHAREYTVNRKKEMANLEELFADGQGMRLIWSDYGGGKTHLLDLAGHQALTENFLMGRLVLDPSEVPASHPQRLFSAFISSLRYPGQLEQGWRPLFERLQGCKEHLDPAGRSFSRYLSPVLHTLGSGDEEAIGWVSDYIEGYPMDMGELSKVVRLAGWRGPGLMALSNFRTYGRVYTRLLGTLACWARDAGFRGLVLLMDEMEYLDFLPAGLRHLASEVLKHFAAATLGEGQLRFDQNELYRGGHQIHRAIDIRHQDDQPLIAMMALTPLEETTILTRQVLDPDPKSPLHLILGEMNGKSLKTLLNKILKLYRLAYPGFKPAKESIQEIQEWVLKEELLGLSGISPREAVRSMVLMLDSLRYGRTPFPVMVDDNDERFDWDEPEEDEVIFQLSRRP